MPQDRACGTLCAERWSLALIVLPCGSFRLAGHSVSGRDGIGAWQNCKVIRFKMGSWMYRAEDDRSTGATVAGHSHSLTSTFLGGVYSLFLVLSVHVFLLSCCDLKCSADCAVASAAPLLSLVGAFNGCLLFLARHPQKVAAARTLFIGSL